LAAAAAQCGRADAAAAARECQRQVQGDPGTGHSQWVTQRDRAAVHVDPRGVQAQLTGADDADSREGLVDLHQVQVCCEHSASGTGLFDFLGGLQLQG
jgi:hypothetical protein